MDMGHEQIDKLWLEAEKTFVSKRSFRDTWRIITGTNRPSQNQLSKRMNRDHIKAFANKLDGLSAIALTALLNRAEMHRSLASENFRATAIVNVTLPIALLTLMVELLDHKLSIAFSNPDHLIARIFNAPVMWVTIGTTIIFVIAYLAQSYSAATEAGRMVKLFTMKRDIALINEGEEYNKTIPNKAHEKGEE